MKDLSTTISMKIFSDDMHSGNTRDIYIHTWHVGIYVKKKIKAGKTMEK